MKKKASKNITLVDEKINIDNIGLVQETLNIAGVAGWELDTHSGKLLWTDNAADILADKKNNLNTIEDLTAYFNKDSAVLLSAAINGANENGFTFHLHLTAEKLPFKRFIIKCTPNKSHQKNDMLRGSIQDITSRRLKEIAIETLNKELLQSNKELEHFAYIASHDLQEPLRMVSSFLGLLESKYKTQLDDPAKQYIEYAVDGANRMRILIAELLDYSRIGVNQDPFIDTDVNECLKNILEFFAPHLQQTQAKIIIQPMPVIKGSAIQITQLLQNIIGNALKYNRSAVPEIEIGVKEKKDHWQFFVKDNGIGIDAQYFEKIFIIFQRLHNRKDFSGTGIGLAICKKIVDRHAGKIWVKSTENEGSTFFFTIKK